LKKNIQKFAVVIILIIATIIYVAIPYKSKQLNSASQEDLDHYIVSKMEELRIPGMALGIVEGNEVFLKGYGYSSISASNEIITPKTPFLLGSTTKSITAMAIMQLYEEGLLDLDEKVVRYLPTFRFENQEESNKITIRHLLNQTSGIAGSAGGSDYLDGSGTREEFITELKDETLLVTPGSTYQYAEANYVILGEVISVVAGQSYEDYIKEKIFIPLNMKNSCTNQEDALKNGLAHGNITWFGYPVKTDLPYPKKYASASVVYSSVEDLTHYVSCYLSGGDYQNKEILSNKGIQEITRPAVELEHPEGYFYGMGWFVSNGFAIHDGRPTNYYSVILLNPENNKGIILLANANNRLIVAEYLMPIVFEIMDTLDGIDTRTSGIGYRQLYKILNALLAWIFIFCIGRIVSTLKNRTNKVKISNFIIDGVLLLVITGLLVYLLRAYGVSLSIAYLGQPDIVFCMVSYIVLLVSNIVMKIVYAVKSLR